MGCWIIGDPIRMVELIRFRPVSNPPSVDVSICGKQYESVYTRISFDYENGRRLSTCFLVCFIIIFLFAHILFLFPHSVRLSSVYSATPSMYESFTTSFVFPKDSNYDK